MKMFLSVRPSWLVAVSFLALLVTSPLRAAQTSPAASSANGAVTVVDNGNTWTLDNGIVKATITKNSGSMPSLSFAMRSNTGLASRARLS